MPENPVAHQGVADTFRDRFGHPPEGVWQAPGRVNLIGEHTDYNAGLALPFAIDRHVVVAGARSHDRGVTAWSGQEGGDVGGWLTYPRAVLSAFREAGIDVPGVDLIVDSDVPLGAGLASSAALVGAVALAVDGLSDVGLGPRRLAQLCHRAESHFVGVPVGMLDPLAVLFGRQDHGLLIDFQDLSIEVLPLPPGSMVVVDTGVRHRLGDGAYAERRRQCHEAATQLGVADLRMATREDVEGRLDGVLRRRARHMVTENERVIEAARRLRATGGRADLGDLLWASHASLRDDFEVSCPELDAVIEAARAAGAGGARLTGAGFGGCAIVVGLRVDEAAAVLARHPGVADGTTAFSVTPSGGAGRLA